MPTIDIFVGDCRNVLHNLPDNFYHTCVTSPPYFGLRDYGVSGQMGLEESPDKYVAELVSVFRELRRVLRDDGTFWLNLGDSYASAWACNRRNVVGNGSLPDGTRDARPNRLVDGLKEKHLIGVPWRVALGLQKDGGHLRQEIIWHKPNPMPDGVRDRCTKAHEHLFLLTKSRRYHFDAAAIAEATADGRGTRNRRSVWTIPTKPYKGTHFATFPPALVEPCILAGCPVGGNVLDPFAGAGTTGLVARSLGRTATLIELNPPYAAQAWERIHGPQGNPFTAPSEALVA